MFNFSIFDLRKYIFANLLSLLAYVILFFTIYVFLINVFIIPSCFQISISVPTLSKIYSSFYLLIILMFIFFVWEILISLICKKYFLKIIKTKKINLIYSITFYVGISGILIFFILYSHIVKMFGFLPWG